MDWLEQLRRQKEEHPKIMADLAAGMSVIQVATKYGISRGRVYQIKAKYAEPNDGSKKRRKAAKRPTR